MLKDVRIHYYRVHDLDYPRNRRVRAYLQQQGATVTVAKPSVRRGRVRRLLDDVIGLVRAARRSDVIILSEMRLKHAGYVGLIGKTLGCVVVVDGFIGLYETEIGDWAISAPGSLRARSLRLLDRIAVRAADVYLVDTDLRAAHVRTKVRNTLVRSLPVGAPAWAVPQESDRADDVLHVLYYGNYIPLHGLGLVLEAIAAAAKVRPMRVTFIGNGPRRAFYESKAAELGLEAVVAFREPVAESALKQEIAGADVVLGVFGTSMKARSVIANKVWQGLACGRTTVTQQSSALTEIESAAGGLLVQVCAENADGLARVLRDADSAPDGAAGLNAAQALESIVRAGYDAFASDLATMVRK